MIFLFALKLQIGIEKVNKNVTKEKMNTDKRSEA